MSAFVVNLVFKSARITKLGELCALLAIADEANGDGFCAQQRKYLSKKSRLTERAFSRIIGRFLRGDNPVLTVAIGGGRGRVSQYQINVEALLQSVKTGTEKTGTLTTKGDREPGTLTTKGDREPGTLTTKRDRETGTLTTKRDRETGKEKRGPRKPGLSRQRGTEKPGLSRQRGTEKPGLSRQKGTDVPVLEKDTSSLRILPKKGVSKKRARTREANLNKPNGFVKPTASELTEYFEEIGSTKDESEAFFDHYESIGWEVGKASKKMKNWEASARGWVRRSKKFESSRRSKIEPGRHWPEPLN